MTGDDSVISLLDRPLYRFAEADRLLRVTPGTVKRWVDGYTRKGVSYEPIVRETSTGEPWVTWGEFVEARLLREFRPDIPTIRLRPLVQRLREVFNKKYPLSYSRPFLMREGQELVMQAQRDTGTPQELWIVVSTGQTLIPTAEARAFTNAARFEDDGGPVRYIQARAATPAVLLDPLRRQGQPTVHGVTTAALAELVRAGDPIELVADTYGFTVDEVEQAVAYESSSAA